MTALGFAALGVLLLCLAAFAWASGLAAEAAGRPVWLLGRATGRDRLAALGFRAAFALALLGPPLLAAWPGLAAADPLWARGGAVAGGAGLLAAVAGAMLAWGAQVGMGAFWRVGVALAVPTLVTLAAVGLFWLSARIQIITEERLLRARFGAAYAARVPRWLGVPCQPTSGGAIDS